MLNWPRRFRAISVTAAVYLILTSSVAAGAARVLHSRLAHSPSTAQHPAVASAASAKYLVLLVLDGAEPAYLNTGNLPHINALKSSGTLFTNTIAGILEAETPAGHATIATGSKPDLNGILGFDWANDNDQRYSLFNPNKMGSLEQILQDNHAPTIAGLYKKAYPGTRAVALSGHKYYAAAPLGGPNADAIMYFQGDARGHYVPVSVPGHTPPAGVLNAPTVTAPTTHLKDGQEDHLVTNLALVAVNKMLPRVLLINYPEFDWPLGHVDGGMLNRAKVVTDMQGVDSDLGRIENLYRAKGILNQTLFVVTADHGMMPIKRFVPASEIAGAISRAGTSAPDIASSSADFIWLANGAKGQAVAQNVINLRDPGIQSAYYLVTTNHKPHYVLANWAAVKPAMRKANQFLLHSLMNGHQPTVVVFGREDVSFSDPKTGWKADHGGASHQSQHMPLLISGPGIRKNVRVTSPAQMDDIAPTVLADMGVEPAGMEGHVLADALQNPTAAAKQIRSAELRRLTPVMTALNAQDGLNAAGQ